MRVKINGECFLLGEYFMLERQDLRVGSGLNSEKKGGHSFSK